MVYLASGGEESSASTLALEKAVFNVVLQMLRPGKDFLCPLDRKLNVL